MGTTKNTQITKMQHEVFSSVMDHDGEILGTVLGFSDLYKYDACSKCRKKIGIDLFCQKCKETATPIVSFKVIYILTLKFCKNISNVGFFYTSHPLFLGVSHDLSNSPILLLPVQVLRTIHLSLGLF